MATLDPEAAASLPEGTRISVWATQKERGPQGTSVNVGKTLICTLQSGRTETVACKTQFHNSTLLSFSVQPQKGSGAVHLAGFFDHKFDKAPDVGDQMTWSEFQALLADARAMQDEDEDDEKEGGDNTIEAAEQHASAAEGDEGRRPVRAVRQDSAAKQSRAGGNAEPAEKKTEKEAGPGASEAKQGEKGGSRKEGASAHQTSGATEDVGSKRKRQGAAGGEEGGPKKKKPSGGVKATKEKEVKLEDGVSYADQELGYGKVVKFGSKVSLKLQRMKGKKAEGEEVPVRFIVGLRKVASGLDTALRGMRAGGKRVVRLDGNAHDAPVHKDWPKGSPITLVVTASKVTD